jgi:hypothetical protein
MVTATSFLTPAMAQKIPMSRQVVATAVRAKVLPLDASTLRQAQSAVEK